MLHFRFSVQGARDGINTQFYIPCFCWVHRKQRARVMSIAPLRTRNSLSHASCDLAPWESWRREKVVESHGSREGWRLHRAWVCEPGIGNESCVHLDGTGYFTPMKSTWWAAGDRDNVRSFAPCPWGAWHSGCQAWKPFREPETPGQLNPLVLGYEMASAPGCTWDHWGASLTPPQAKFQSPLIHVCSYLLFPKPQPVSNRWDTERSKIFFYLENRDDFHVMPCTRHYVDAQGIRPCT